MSLTAWIFAGCVLTISHAGVAILALMYGKAHPTVQSKIAGLVDKAEKKVGI